MARKKQKPKEVVIAAVGRSCNALTINPEATLQALQVGWDPGDYGRIACMINDALAPNPRLSYEEVQDLVSHGKRVQDLLDLTEERLP